MLPFVNASFTSVPTAAVDTGTHCSVTCRAASAFSSDLSASINAEAPAYCVLPPLE